MAPSGDTCLVAALGPSVLVVLGASGAKEGSHLAWLLGGRGSLVCERGWDLSSGLFNLCLLAKKMIWVEQA